MTAGASKYTADIEVPEEQRVWQFDRTTPPVAEMRSGQTVRFFTRDCYDRQIKSADTLRSQIDGSRINPAAGPVAVTDAEPGQCLAVEILELTPETRGFMPLRAGSGILGAQVTTETQLILETADGKVHFPGGIEAPLSPLIGVIGVAPAGGPVRTVFPGDHGGNMDVREMAPGSTLYLPVFAPGAGLCLGDVHGRSGDGELGGNGIETAAECVCRITVRAGLPYGRAREGCWPLRRPVLERDERLYFIASAALLEDAVRTATVDAVDFVMAARGLSFEIAYRVVSVLGDIRIAQVVNDISTVKLLLDRREIGC